jgi:cytochrome b6-f complex iron-sulfur subunit
MDAVVENSTMETIHDTNRGEDSPKAEAEEKQKAPPKVEAKAEVEDKQKASPKVEAKTKPAPPAQKASATAATPTARGVGSSAGAKTKTVASDEPPDPVNKMRRRITWTAIIGFLTVNFLMFLRFFLPRTIFEPPTVFRIGYPSDFGFGVDTKFQQQYRIWVVRNAERLFVIYARCTHLGCTPDWKGAENKFKCPCHGSGFTSEGINFEGPAPRPLDRARVEVDPTGQIVVDTSRLYEWPKGETSEFDEDGAYINV